MERRIALAVAASATVLLASTTVGAAVFGGVSVLGFGHKSTTASSDAIDPVADGRPKVVTRYRDVYDRVLFDTPTNDGSGASSAPFELSATRQREIAGPASPVATPTSNPAAPPRRPASSRRPTTRAPSGATPTTVATAPPGSVTTTSTSVPVTTTTWPSGVPRDWPPGKPIPPKPPGCRDGQLEDDGYWNCQH
jgi:hypothetical protein